MVASFLASVLEESGFKRGQILIWSEERQRYEALRTPVCRNGLGSMIATTVPFFGAPGRAATISASLMCSRVHAFLLVHRVLHLLHRSDDASRGRSGD